jgi:hypothetical protein
MVGFLLSVDVSYAQLRVPKLSSKSAPRNREFRFKRNRPTLHATLVPL